MKTILDRISWRALFIVFGILVVIRVLPEI
jgi:hypothetical protein